MNPPSLPDNKKIESVRIGQRLILAAIVLNLITISLQFIGDGEVALMLTTVAMITGPLAFVLSLIGILWMSAGLGFKVIWRIVFCLLMLIPLINLMILLTLNFKATQALRKSGYRVGLLGANKQQLKAD